MQFPSRNEIESLRRKYPKDTVVELEHMDDYYAPSPGTRGVVKSVDGMGHIQVCWDNGSSLALVPGVDRFHIVEEIL